MRKKLISSLLSFVMLFSCFMCLPAVAAEAIGAGSTVISGNSYTGISAEGVTNSQPATGMSPSSWAEYEVTPAAGTYAVYATVAANKETTPKLYCTADGSPVGTADVPGLGWQASEAEGGIYKSEIFLGYVSLSAATHALRFQAQDASMRLLEIRLYGVTEETEQAFLAALKNADTAAEVEAILGAYESSLFLSYTEALEKVYYKTLVYEQMLLLPHNSLLETDQYFLNLVAEEEQEPLVTVTQNGEAVTDIAAGSLTIDIGARFSEDLVAVAALYNSAGDRLHQLVSAQVTAYQSAQLTGLTATEEATSLRIFFLNSLAFLQPAALPLVQSSVYVSPAGNDAAKGTVEAPLQSFGAAVSRVSELNTLVPGDITVYLAPGEYFISETVAMDESAGGQNGHSITYQSLDAQNPATLSGGVEVSGWLDEDGDGIYEVTVPEDITDMRQLYINGNPARRARSSHLYRAAAYWDNPDTEVYSYDVWTSATEYTTYTVYDKDGFIVTDASFPVLQKPEDAEAVHVINFGLQRLPVQGITYDSEAGTATVMMEPQPYAEAISMICDGGIQPTLAQQFYLENDLALLDEAGEFYFNKEEKVLYYKPFPEESLAEAETVIAQTEQLLTMGGTSLESKISNVHFKNVSIRYGGYYTEVNDYGAVTFQAENLVKKGDDLTSGIHQNPVSTGRTLMAQIEITNADNITFTDCDISCMGSSALRMGDGVTDSAVTGCILRDNGGSALSIGNWKASTGSTAETLAAAQAKLATGISIENNVITRAGLDFMFTPAVTVYYANAVAITHNDISDVPYTAVSVGWGWNNPNNETVETPEKLACYGHRIDNNRIDYTSHTLWDGGQVYMLGYMKEDVTVNNNYLSRGYGGFGGIYFDTGGDAGEVSGNVIDDTENWFFGGGHAQQLNLHDNYAEAAAKRTYSLSDENPDDDVTIYADKNWPEAALDVIAAAGVGEAYEALLEEAALPAWREGLHLVLPAEYVAENAIYVAAGDYTDFEVDPTNKTKPQVMTRNGYGTIQDYRQSEWLAYTVNIETADAYTFTLDYSAGESESYNPSVKIFANPEARLQYGITNWPIADIIMTLTEKKLSSGAFLRQTAETTLTLTQGENTIYIGNYGGVQPNLRGFCLTPVTP